MKYICPVCGYRDLSETPFDEYGKGSFDICPSCGTEFGYRDTVEYLIELGPIHSKFRKKWIKNGMRWHSSFHSPPKNWDPSRQLENLVFVQEEKYPANYEFPNTTEPNSEK